MSLKKGEEAELREKEKEMKRLETQEGATSPYVPLEDQPEETCEKCDKKEQGSVPEVIRDLTRELNKILSAHVTPEDRAFRKFFGIPKSDTKILIVSFPPYKRSQAIYSLNHFVMENTNIKFLTNFDGDEMSPAYESIQVRRGATEVLLSVGYYFMTYKRTKFILELYFSGCSMSSRLYFRPRDEKKASRLNKAITAYLKKRNFMKGEKLVLKSRGYIEFLEYPELHWKNIILPAKTKEEFMLNIIFSLENEKKCVKHGLPWRRGLMLGGKAGTGKTQVCRILCNELPKDVTLIWATPKALYNTEMIQHLFKAARYFSPTLIIIEDIDFIGQSRDFAQNPILGELLTQLDGNDPNHGVFVISTTNRPELLDEALANRPSRFDIQIKFSLPSENERKQLVKLFTNNMEFAESLD